jgi:hypothetical protein
MPTVPPLAKVFSTVVRDPTVVLRTPQDPQALRNHIDRIMELAANSCVGTRSPLALRRHDRGRSSTTSSSGAVVGERVAAPTRTLVETVSTLWSKTIVDCGPER